VKHDKFTDRKLTTVSGAIQSEKVIVARNMTMA